MAKDTMLCTVKSGCTENNAAEGEKKRKRSANKRQTKTAAPHWPLQSLVEWQGPGTRVRECGKARRKDGGILAPDRLQERRPWRLGLSPKQMPLLGDGTRNALCALAGTRARAAGEIQIQPCSRGRPGEFGWCKSAMLYPMLREQARATVKGTLLVG